jgi:hypothetical protein
VFPKTTGAPSQRSGDPHRAPAHPWDNYRKFIAEYVGALKPDGMIEIQLAQRLAQDTWRINRVHAIEENIFALGHSEPYANIKSAHPEIHAAMVQALTFRNDPKLLSPRALRATADEELPRQLQPAPQTPVLTPARARQGKNHDGRRIVRFAKVG